MIKILVDGDSCRVLDTVEYIAESKHIDCHIYCDITRTITTDYSELHIVDTGRDMADFAIANNCCPNDIVITNDSGLASLVLSRHGFALNSYGIEYTKENIISFLTSRHIRSHEQARSKHHKVKNSLRPITKQRPFDVQLLRIIKKAQYKEQESEQYNA